MIRGCGRIGRLGHLRLDSVSLDFGMAGGRSAILVLNSQGFQF